ncbi:hypothetical protein EYF80_006192 [Liparis tanakae]|uniref:Uncharacterized protein n=1 Tax=Liparis tanakae TaxID=230148 RepID=A0A4Z2J1I9_9TELE|nr:hypothetical protein EYF80_006192 [Liparis tanakae]
MALSQDATAPESTALLEADEDYRDSKPPSIKACREHHRKRRRWWRKRSGGDSSQKGRRHERLANGN